MNSQWGVLGKITNNNIFKDSNWSETQRWDRLSVELRCFARTAGGLNRSRLAPIAADLTAQIERIASWFGECQRNSQYSADHKNEMGSGEFHKSSDRGFVDGVREFVL
ncbi:MAG: hypothetical protein R3C28_15095 [Pirellulaceae bacterium]